MIEDITYSIIKDWKTLNSNKSDYKVSQIKVKHLDHNLGIYTIYFKSGNDTIRIKALKNPYTKLTSLVRRLQNLFSIELKDTWKIIDMT